MIEHYTECFEGFPPPGELSAKKLARRTDPETSKEAAERIKPHLGELHRWAQSCVQEAPGLTQRELGAKFCATDPRRIGRRLNECELLGLVKRGVARKCSISGRMADTWYPTTE